MPPGRPVLAQSSAERSARQKAIEDLKLVAYAGDATAQVRLGLIYLTGDGVAKDDAEALKWIHKAADQDNPVGERYLAEMYFKGRGVPADNSEAAKWLRMAAEQGDAESEHNLAVLVIHPRARCTQKHETGSGVDAQISRPGPGRRRNWVWEFYMRTATAWPKIPSKP